ncbi:MAG: hypothetical protein SCK57_02620 [Bacillota bacterium]|nr:hypothetical protein [Bacillota bacterium]MDW7676534.1 hypothetical protein [Bacillota bacterium]
MKRKLITSTLVMMLAAFSVSGGVVAWFTSGTSGEMQTYSVGTLRISKPELTDNSPEGPWRGGDAVQLTYDVENVGDREVYLRVKPLVKYVGTPTEGAPYSLEASPTGWLSSGEWWYYGDVDNPAVLRKDSTLSIDLTVTLAPDAMGSLSFALEAEAILAMTAAMEELWKDDPTPWSGGGIQGMTLPVEEPEPGQDSDPELTPEPEGEIPGEPAPEQAPEAADEPAPKPEPEPEAETETASEEEPLQE